MESNLHYTAIAPIAPLRDYIESFWFLDNHASVQKDIYVLPDGRIDLIYSKSPDEALHATLLGLGTACAHASIRPFQRNFAVSFKPLAFDFLFPEGIADLVDSIRNLPAPFWEIDDMQNFHAFVTKISQKVLSLLPPEMDPRKAKLFRAIYASGGELRVQEVAKEVGWSSRQINRYFQSRLGVSLKT